MGNRSTTMMTKPPSKLDKIKEDSDSDDEEDGDKEKN